MPYTTLQKIRRFNAQHHANNSRMVSAFAANSETFKRRQRGEYSSLERKILENTAKMIANTLELDSNVKRLRILLRKEDKLQAIKKKRQA